MKRIRPVLFVLYCLAAGVVFESCSMFMTRPESVPTGIIDADDPAIRYSGRFDFSNPKNVVFDWPGVSITASFKGSSVAVRLKDRTNEYAVIIDNHAPRILTPDSSGISRIATGLTDSLIHTITIRKRTESLVGKGEFMGFIVDRGRILLPLPPPSERRIEFIGNSITSGYGDEGDSTGHFDPKTENATMAYAAITARALQADYHLVSYSGRGMVRNYGDSSMVSREPMPALYERICFADSVKKWDFSSWIPQAVVINLGTNDFSTRPHPDSTTFTGAYIRFVNRVRALYPGVTIFCVCGPMIAEPCTGYVRAVVESLTKKRDNDIFYVEIKPSELGPADWGADHHPNITGMSIMAGRLAPVIRLYMNW